MTSREIDIDLIPVKQLVAFSAEIEANPVKFAVAPIDPHRALAHSKNPVARDQDIGMVVAYSSGKCIGYVGMMPMMGKIDGESRKILAPTTQFVHPDFRKKPPDWPGTVADMMYQKAFTTGHDQMITGFNEPGERIYSRRPEWFTPLSSYQFLRIRLTPFQPLSSAIRRVALKTGNKALTKAYALSHSVFNKPLEGLVEKVLQVKRDVRLNSIQVVQTPLLDVESNSSYRSSENTNMSVAGCHHPATNNCLATHPQGEDTLRQGTTILGQSAKADSNPSFPRSQAVINWMISLPWHETGKVSYPRYHFHNPRDRFGYHAYHLFNPQNVLVGYFVLCYSTERLYTTVRILDYHLDADDANKFIFNIALQKALALGANQIECGGEFLPSINTSSLLRKLITILERKYFMFMAPDSPFRGREHQVKLSYCDGERPFI